MPQFFLSVHNGREAKDEKKEAKKQDPETGPASIGRHERRTLVSGPQYQGQARCGAGLQRDDCQTP